MSTTDRRTPKSEPLSTESGDFTPDARVWFDRRNPVLQTEERPALSAPTDDLRLPCRARLARAPTPPRHLGPRHGDQSRPDHPRGPDCGRARRARRAPRRRRCASTSTSLVAAGLVEASFHLAAARVARARSTRRCRARSPRSTSRGGRRAAPAQQPARGGVRRQQRGCHPDAAGGGPPVGRRARPGRPGIHARENAGTVAEQGRPDARRPARVGLHPGDVDLRRRAHRPPRAQAARSWPWPSTTRPWSAASTAA